MSSVARYVAVKQDGVIQVHASGHDIPGGYATLCGMDGDDPGVGQSPASLPVKAKIDCPHCKDIIFAAQKYSGKDLS